MARDLISNKLSKTTLMENILMTMKMVMRMEVANMVQAIIWNKSIVDEVKMIMKEEHFSAVGVRRVIYLTLLCILILSRNMEEFNPKVLTQHQCTQEEVEVGQEKRDKLNILVRYTIFLIFLKVKLLHKITIHNFLKI